MKKIFPVLGVVVLAGVLAMTASPFGSQAASGNGAPSGAHYNLNIIGVQNPKTADMTDSTGHVIFVPLIGKTRIMLTQGEYQVLDANGTDGKAAFQLPNPDPTNSGTTTYSVYVRTLGKPGGQASMNTCATTTVVNPDTGLTEEICSVGVLKMERTAGKSSFQDVSKYLLYIYADVDFDGVQERVPLFDASLQDYFWSYDNQGMKHIQLRFYPIPTTVPATM
ncbi:MAG: hypothetical protein ACM3KM_03110 [Acidobacteriaceae bacterium]